MTEALVVCTGRYEEDAARGYISSAGLNVGISHHLSERTGGEGRQATANRQYSEQSFYFIFYKHLTLSSQISAPSKSCYCHICCIRPYIDFKIASTIITLIFHSKFDYCIHVEPSEK